MCLHGANGSLQPRANKKMKLSVLQLKETECCPKPCDQGSRFFPRPVSEENTDLAKSYETKQRIQLSHSPTLYPPKLRDNKRVLFKKVTNFVVIFHIIDNQYRFFLNLILRQSLLQRQVAFSLAPRNYWIENFQGVPGTYHICRKYHGL